MTFKKGHPIYKESEKTQFKKGNSGYWLGKKRPNLWNGAREDMKGKHFSPNTEIKEGEHIGEKTEFKKGNIQSEEIILKRNNTLKKLYATGKINIWSKGLTPRKEKYRQKRTKINGKEIPESHLVWLKANQLHRVPPHCLIHHRDFNPKNNSPDNLQLLDNKTHGKFHVEAMRIMRKFS